MEEPTANDNRPGQEDDDVDSADMEAVVNLGVVLSFCDLPVLRSLRSCCKLFRICVDEELDQRIEKEIIPRLESCPFWLEGCPISFTIYASCPIYGSCPAFMGLRLGWSEANSTEDGLVREAIEYSDPDRGYPSDNSAVLDKVALEHALRRDSKALNVRDYFQGQIGFNWSIYITKPRSVEQEFALGKCKKYLKRCKNRELRDYIWALLCRTESYRYSRRQYSCLDEVSSEENRFHSGYVPFPPNNEPFGMLWPIEVYREELDCIFFRLGGRHGNQKLEFYMHNFTSWDERPPQRF